MRKGLRTLKNQYIFEIGSILILFITFSGFVFSQTTTLTTNNSKSKTTPKPKPKAKPAPQVVCEDCDPESPLEPPAATIYPKGNKNLPETSTGSDLNRGMRVQNENDIPYEKSIAVDSEVSINLQVCEGNVRINGWERDEVRVFVSGGSKVGFRAAAPKRKDSKTASITVLGYDPKVDKGELSNCLYGDEIELDVPVGARISKLRSGDAKITIKSISRVFLENTSGDIFLNDIDEEIWAKTYEGDITVENSSGSITLETFDGEIFAYDTEPLDIGDTLKLKANNSINIQSVSHSFIEASSTSGSIYFSGELQTDGQYTFKNNKGQILLAIPEESSCTVEVLAQKGKFNYTDVPLKILTDNIQPASIRKLVGKMGEGDANITLVSSTGRIIIKKLN